MAGAAPKNHAGNSDGDTAIELLIEVVTWVSARVVWEAKRDEKLGLRPCFYLRRCWRSITLALGAVGPRAAAAPVALSLGNDGSPL